MFFLYSDAAELTWICTGYIRIEVCISVVLGCFCVNLRLSVALENNSCYILAVAPETNQVDKSSLRLFNSLATLPICCNFQSISLYILSHILQHFFLPHSFGILKTLRNFRSLVSWIFMTKVWPHVGCDDFNLACFISCRMPVHHLKFSKQKSILKGLTNLLSCFCPNTACTQQGPNV